MGDLGIEGIYSSPQTRAMETTAPYAEATGIPAQAVDGLAECAFNRVWAVDFLDLVRRHWSDFDYSMPNCESHRMCQSRFLRTLHEIAGANFGKALICCSGGQAISLALQSIDPSVGYEDWANISAPDIYKLDWDGERLGWDRSYVFGGPESLLSD
jgi:2,3-bisphosphoglycerate-dependent phosphoglycerate mutase